MPLPASPRLKSWDEFAEPDAPVMDAVVTVRASAEGGTSTIWPRRPGRGNCAMDDPATASGSAAKVHAAFKAACQKLKIRADAFFALNPTSLPAEANAGALRKIGATE